MKGPFSERGICSGGENQDIVIHEREGVDSHGMNFKI
jgi:hypothetical protein